MKKKRCKEVVDWITERSMAEVVVTYKFLDKLTECKGCGSHGEIG